MSKLRYFIYTLAGITLFLILAWLIVIPSDLLREKAEDAVSSMGNSKLDLTVSGLSKGILFSLKANQIDLSFDGKEALIINNFSGQYSPGYIADKALGFTVKGKIGSGSLTGFIKYPLDGNIHIDRADLSAIPYIMRFGIETRGKLNSDINIGSDEVKVTFAIPDLFIDDRDSLIPLLNTFRKVQGSLRIKGDIITFDSVSIDGEKGYARLSGTVQNNYMNLSLELMPESDRLNTMESMMIGKYTVSPGYYVVPITGPVP